MQKLREKTFVASTKQVARNHASWLRDNRHLRYMWLPYTDSVVVVQVRVLGFRGLFYVSASQGPIPCCINQAGGLELCLIFVNHASWLRTDTCGTCGCRTQTVLWWYR